MAKVILLSVRSSLKFIRAAALEVFGVCNILTDLIGSNFEGMFTMKTNKLKDN